MSPDTSISKSAVGQVVLKWSSANAGLVEQPPSVAAGTVYVGGFDAFCCPQPQATIYAFDAQTGASKWSTTNASTSLSSPIVANGVVYFTAEGTLRAVDAATGAFKWQGGSGGEPTVANGVVYLAAGSTLQAIDAAGVTNCSRQICAPLWSQSISPDSIPSFGPPAVANGVVYVTGSNALYAFDATNGTLLWKTSSAASFLTDVTNLFASPAVANGVVYVGGFDPSDTTVGKLYAFDAGGTRNCGTFPGLLKRCQPLWTAGTIGTVMNPPAVAYGSVYAATSGPNGSTPGALQVFDASGNTNCSGTPKTCSTIWTAPIAGNPSPIAIANGVVYLGDGVSKVEAFDAAGSTNCSGTPTSCSPLWSVNANGSLIPVVANGFIYVGEGDFHSSTPGVVAYGLP